MTHYFDPWNRDHTAGRTPDDIDRCLRESVAAMRAAEPQPTSGPEPAVDETTHLNPRPLRTITRGRLLRVNSDGYSGRGEGMTFYGTPGVDFDV